MRLINADALKEDFKSRLTCCNDWIEKAKDKETKIRASAVKTFIGEVIMTIDNAPTVEQIDDTELQRAIGYAEGYSKGRNERPQGEWITVHKQNSFGQDCVCFECNKCHKYKMPLYKLMITEPLEVCPNCGARMGGGKE